MQAILDMDVHNDMCSSDSDSNEESDIHSPGRENQNIRPYQFEPVFLGNREQVEENDHQSNSQTQSRAGYLFWCQCGHCREMETDIESLCCKEEVPTEYLLEKDCVALSSNFAAVKRC